METQQMTAQLDQSLSVQDHELFERVWRRVMPDQEQSPIAIGPAPEIPTQDDPASRQPRFPLSETEPDDLPQLGRASMEYAQTLRDMMEKAQDSRQFYQSLSRRTQGQTARTLSSLAVRHQQDLRRLGAVYFLLTGERFHPPVRQNTPVGTLGSALREMFRREQRQGHTYALAARNNPDPCLKTLFLELQEESRLHLDDIRAILERM